MLLWASSELPEVLTTEQQQATLTDIFEQQNGWSLGSLGAWEREDGLAQDARSDGYATGLIGYVLQRAGVATTDPKLSRGLGWLVEHQDPMGGQWLAHSLNKQRDPQSDRGRFMADAATAFAVLALTAGDSPISPR